MKGRAKFYVLLQRRFRWVFSSSFNLDISTVNCTTESEDIQREKVALNPLVFSWSVYSNLVFVEEIKDQGSVLRRPISANPGLNFNLGFYFSLFKSCLRIIFSIYFQSIQSKNWRQKDFSWIFFFKLSDLKSNFILILGYLNPALNNPALVGEEHCEGKVHCSRTTHNDKAWAKPRAQLFEG